MMQLNETKLIASVCKDSFYEFVKEFWDIVVQEQPVFNWHIKYLCDELQFVAERVFRNQPKLYDLCINVPPGSTKSTICSQMFIAWVWTRMPSSKFICPSYAYTVAIQNSTKTRDIVMSDKYRLYFPGIELREDQNMKGMFVNTQKGFRLAAGVGGSVTGFHAHFLIPDDPINPEKSYSEAELRTTNRWMETTLPSRKVDKHVAVTILVMQRLAQGDPSGEMIEKAAKLGQSIKHICIPGELTEKVSPVELRDYYIDGLMDPVRMPREVLDLLEKDLGDYGYSSQILQDPVPLGGGLFKTEQLIIVNEPMSKPVRLVRSWDKAGTKGGRGAYTCGTLMCVGKDKSYGVLDVVRGRWGATEREAIILKTAETDEQKYGVVEIELEIEGGSGGKESGENTVKNLAGYVVHVTHPTGDKETRAYPLASQVGAGNVWALDKPWLKEWKDEFRHFPHSKYKDQVDSASGAFNRLHKRTRKVGGAW